VGDQKPDGASLKNKALDGWKLFWLISGLISAVMLIGVALSDLSTAPGVSSMIQLSARCAVVFLYLAFVASSLRVIFCSDFSAWVLRNRKYFGLSFAVSMGWQAVFILWMVGLHRDYYVDEVYLLRDVIEGLVGYAFVILMAITSFRPGRRLLGRKRWRLLHKSGIYYLWAYAFSVYWWALFYYGNPVFIDYLFYWAGFVAWVARAVAWYKGRRQSAEKDGLRGDPPLWARLIGIGIIAFGGMAATFGSAWVGLSEDFLYGYAFTRIPELYIPYWPFEPFLPLFMIALGICLLGAFRSGPVPEQALKAE
jgi:DMSO/TMAO reductase YedYZ heme-binding membrane subunit